MAKNKKDDKGGDGSRVLAGNRRARFEYFLDDHTEAGIVLTGTEVKSLRDGKASLAEAWVKVDGNGEAWLMQAHIQEYAFGNRENHDPTRPRKLLLHRHEIERLASSTREMGMAIVPTKIYLTKNGLIKLEVAVGKGKNVADKRDTIKKRQAKREVERALKHR